MKRLSLRLTRPVFTLFALFICLSFSVSGQIYQHNFDSGPYNYPYTAAPSILDPNLTNGSWTNTAGYWTSYTGVSGNALAISSASATTTTLTLTFSVNSGYQLTVNSFSFYRRSSSSGYANWSMTINGIYVGSGTANVNGSSTPLSTGTISVANPVSNLTGTITVEMVLSGGSHGSSGTFRYDEFALNGLVSPVCVAPTLGTSVTDVSCYGSTDGIIDLTATGGTTPLSYSWTGPNSYTAGTEDISGLSPGTYTVIVTATGGCTATTSATVSEPSQAIINASNNGPVCQGDNIILNASTLSGATYTWTGPLSYNGSGQSVTINNGQPINGGTYTVVASVNGCNSAPATTQVIVKPKPTISLYGSSNPTTCSGTNGSITISGLAPIVNYVINYSQNNIAQPSQTLTSTVTGRITIPNLTAGTYSLITASLNGCASNALGPVTLVNPTSPVISSTSFSDPTTCNGTDGYIVLNGLTANAGFTINYQKNGVPQTPVITTSNASGSVTIPSLGAGNYSNISVTAANGCTGNVSGTITLSSPLAPVISNVTGSNPTVCSGTDGSFTISGLQPNTSYTIDYQQNSIAQPTLTQTSGSTGSITILNLPAGTYSGIIVTLNNCPSAAAGPVTLSDPSAPAISAVTPVNPTTCNGNDGSISISGLTAGTSYTVNYTLNSTAQTPLTLTANAGGTIQMTGLAAGIYGGITLTLNGCSSTPLSSIVLSDPAAPAVTNVASIDPATCSGTDGSITLYGLTAGVSYTVNYTKNTISQAPVNITANASGQVVINNLGAGSYDAIILSVNNCNSNASGPVTLTDPAAPVIASAIATNTTTCNGNDGSIKLTGLDAGTAYTVNYTKNSIAQTPVIINANASGEVIIGGLSAGTYTSITVTYLNCVSNIAGPLNITDPSIPVITTSATSNPTTCSGTNGSITLNGLGANVTYTVHYSKNGTPQAPVNILSDATGAVIITGLTAGNYTNITLTISNCTTAPAGPFTLTDPVAPVIAIANYTPPTTCSGNDGSIIISGLTAGSSYTLSYSKNTMAQTPVILIADASGQLTLSNLTAGNYTNIIATINNCASNIAGPVLLTDPASPAITSLSAANPTTCTGNDGSITLSGLDASTTYTLQYSFNSTPQGPIATTTDAAGDLLISNLTAGTYTAITVNLNGCISNSMGPVTLTDPVLATVTVSAHTDPTTCSGNDGTITLSGLISNTTYDIHYTQNSIAQPTLSLTSDASGNITISNLSAGVYANISVSLNNCTATVAGLVTLTDPAPPFIGSATGTNPTTCNGTDGFISLNGLTPNTSYTVNYHQNSIPQTPLTQFSGATGALTISNLSQGVYSAITVTLNNCLSNIAGPLTLTDPAAPVIANITATNPTTCSGTDGSITLTGLTPNTTYQINYSLNSTPQAPVNLTSDAAGTILISNLASGNYTAITATINNCISNAVSATLTDPATPAISNISFTDVTNCNGTDGSITLHGLTANTTYSIVYDFNTVTQPASNITTDATGDLVISNLIAGSYTNFIVSINNCSSAPAGNIIISNPPVPAISNVSSVNPSACNGTDGAITLSGLTPGATYAVTYDLNSATQPSVNITASGTGTIIIPNLAAGNYTNIFVTLNSCNSNNIASVTLIDPATPVIASVTPSDPTTCNGTDGTLTINGLTPNTTYAVNYNYNTVAQPALSLTSDASGAILISNLAAGIYDNIIVTLNGCTSLPAGPFTLSNPAAPTVTNLTATDLSGCNTADGSITLQGLNPNTSYDVTYTFNAAPPLTVTLISDASGNITISGLGAGNYTNIIVILSGCSAAPLTATINAPAAPVIAGSSATNTTTCGGNDGSITLTGLTPNTSYTLNYNINTVAQPAITISSDASGNITLSNLASGTYDNIAVAINNCISNIVGPINIMDPAAPMITNATGTNPTACSGTDGTIVLSGLTPNTLYNINYTLNTVAQPTLNLTSDASGNINITGLAAGTYASIIISINNCTSNDPGPVTLTDPAAPVIANATGTNPTTCSGTDGFITLTGLAPNTGCTLNYSINTVAQPAITINSDASGNITLSNLASGTYGNISVAINNCISNIVGPINIIDPAAPVIANATGTNPTTCSGTDGFITLTGLAPNTGYTLNYSINTVAQPAITISSDASGDITLGNLGAGTYDNIFVSINNCISNIVGPINIIDPAAPMIANATGTNPTTCSGTDGSITLTGLAPNTTYTVNYSINTIAQPAATISSDASGNITLGNLGAGTYDNIFVSINNCTSNITGPISIIDPAAPVIANATGTNPTTCSGTDGSITLTVLTPNTTYQINYTLNGTPQTPLNLTSDAAGDLIISNLAAGNYTNIFVTFNDCNSNSIASVSLTDPNAPAITSVTPVNPASCNGTDGTLTINGLIANTTYAVDYSYNTTAQPTLTLTSDATGAILISNLTAGVYDNIIVTLNGCTSLPAGPFSLSSPATPNVTNVTVTHLTGCNTADGSITLQGLNPNTSYDVTYTFNTAPPVTITLTSDASGNIIITGLDAGSYTNIIVTLSGCSAAPVTATINAPVAPVISGTTVNNTTTCGGNDGSIVLTGLTPNTNYTLNYSINTVAQPAATVISDASGNIILSNLAAATYDNISVSINNCTSNIVGPINIIDPAAPVIVNITATNPTTCSGTDGSITLTGLTPNTTYQIDYSLNSTPQAPVNLTSDASGTILMSNLSSGNYTAITATINNCISNAVSATLTDPATPAISNISFTDVTNCNGTDGSITLHGLTANTTYSIVYDFNTVTQPASNITTDATGDLVISNLIAGSYTNFIVSINNCSSAPAGNIIISNPPVPAISNVSSVNPSACNGTDGAITLSGLTPGATYAVTYDLNSATQPTVTITASGTGDLMISNLVAGNYTNIFVTFNGCNSNSIASVSLTDPNAPAITSVTPVNPTSCNGTDGTLTINGLTPNTTYAVNYNYNTVAQPALSLTSDASGAILISNLAAGIYDNIIVTLNGCTSLPAGPFTLSNPAAPTVTNLTATDLSGCNTADGSITLQGLNPNTSYDVTYAFNAAPPLTVTLISDASGNITLINLAAATYDNISVSINNCTSNIVGPVTLTDPAAPVIANITATNPSTCSGTDGSITLTGLNPNTSYQIDYSLNSTPQAPLNLTSDASGTILMSNLSGGNYTAITATINNCISNAVSATLTAPAAPVITGSSFTNPSGCGNTDGSITLTGLAANTTYQLDYTFNTIAQPTANSTTDAAGNLILSGLSAGSYTNLFVTINSCVSNSIASITLADPAAPVLSGTSYTDPLSCGSADGTITLNGLSPNTTYSVDYSFNTVAQPSLSLTSDAGGSVIINNLPAGSYSGIFITLNNCVSNTTGPIDLTNPAPSVITANYNGPLCEGDTLLLAATNIAGAQYNWTGPNGFSSNNQDPSINTVQLSDAGTYTVTAALNGCTSAPASVNVVINAKPAVPVIVSNSPVCEGTSLQLNTAAVAGAGYTWWGVNNFSAALQNPDIPNVTTGASGDYHLFISVNGCHSDTATTTVIVHPLPAAPTATSPVEYCENDPATALSANGQNLLWYPAPTGGIGSTTAPVPSTGTPGTTTYFVAQTINGCEGPRTAIDVVVYEKIPADIIALKTTVCQYDTVRIFNTAFSATAVYNWDFDGATVINGSGAGPYLVKWMTNGIKTVRLTIQNGNCITTDTQTMIIRFAPDASFSMPDKVCMGDSISVQAAWGSEEEKSYYWNFSGANVVSGHGYGPYVLQWQTPGVKTVTLVIEKDECPSQPYSDTIEVVPAPEAHIEYVSMNDICSGDTITFKAKTAPGYTLEWTPERYFEGNTDALVSVPVQVTGSVVLHVTDENGCRASDSVFINTHPCCDISLPTAFTPNGDGRNDLFRVITIGHHQVSTFRIVNRWGQTVYESPDETRGWDGMFGGVPQDVGTYFYLIKYKCIDGNIYEKKGEVTLIR